MTEQPDLLVRTPSLFCADSGLDGPGAVAIRGDRIADDVWQARERGVLFDLGHGMNFFSFPIAENFLVDTVSTD